MAEPDRGPRVILDFEFERGLLSIVVRNLGELPAADVRVEFDKAFTGLGGTREMNRLALFSKLRFLAPGRDVRTLLDSSAAYFGRKEPTLLTATISYRSPSGDRRRDVITHDLSIYRDLAYVSEGATDA